MIAVMLFVIVLCLFTQSLDQYVPGNRRFVLAAVLVAYATIRILRLKKKWNQIKESQS
jgi:hypothetical protein